MGDERLAASPVAFAVFDDRRNTQRLCRKLSATLVGRDGAKLTCETKDVSEGGMYVAAPSACGFSVGHRVEFALHEPCKKTGRWLNLAEECYATVVRTEALPGPDTKLGIGLCFDQPVLV